MARPSVLARMVPGGGDVAHQLTPNTPTEAEWLQARKTESVYYPSRVCDVPLHAAAKGHLRDAQMRTVAGSSPSTLVLPNPTTMPKRPPAHDSDSKTRAEADLSTLVGRAQAGDSMAMHDLLDRLGPFVLRVCEASAPGDGADAAQEALIIVFSRLKQLNDSAALFGWARSIAAREAIRWAQKSGRAIPTESGDRAGVADLETDIDVRDALARMTPDHREVLMLRDLRDLDERTVARMLDVSAGTVKSRLHRARRSFRGHWS